MRARCARGIITDVIRYETGTDGRIKALVEVWDAPIDRCWRCWINVEHTVLEVWS